MATLIEREGAVNAKWIATSQEMASNASGPCLFRLSSTANTVRHIKSHSLMIALVLPCLSCTVQRWIAQYLKRCDVICSRQWNGFDPWRNEAHRRRNMHTLSRVGNNGVTWRWPYRRVTCSSRVSVKLCCSFWLQCLLKDGSLASLSHLRCYVCALPNSVCVISGTN